MNEAPPIARYIALPQALPHALRLPPVVRALAEFFVEKAGDAYLVGGAVRDALLGREPEDIDIAVSADAFGIGEELAKALGGRCARLHDDWQVARVMLSDADLSGYIDIATVQGDIEQDLRRRDFTINAMALSIDAGLFDAGQRALVDPCDGTRDLQDGVVRMVSSDALDEDSVRLMRGARLASQFAFSLDSETANVIRERAWRIATVPQERVRDELMRILRMPNASAGIRLLDELGLLCSVMPELADAKGVTQPKEHYWDVFDHLIEAVGWVDAMFCGADDSYPLNLVPRFEGIDDYFGGDVGDGYDRLAFLKLAALLHDIAKPATKTIEASGRIRFLGHHSEGAAAALDMLKRLRFGNRGAEHVAGMVQQHLRPTQMAQKGEMPTKRALYRYYRDAGDIAIDTLYLNMADYLAARGPALKREDWESHCGLISYILAVGLQEEDGRSEPVKPPPLLVNGYDIMERFALMPSRTIGDMIEMVREAQASGEVTSKEQALELVRASLERGGDGA